VYCHTSIWSTVTYSPFFTLSIFSPLPISPPSYMNVLHSCRLVFQVYIHCSKGFCDGISPMNMLCFNQINPCIILPNHFLPALYYSTALGVFCYHIFLYRCLVFQYNSLSIVRFPGPSFPLSPQSNYHKCFLYKSEYMITFAFLFIFIFWIHLPPMRENTQTFSFWTWLT
jgi:hypothetical protein